MEWPHFSLRYDRENIRAGKVRVSHTTIIFPTNEYIDFIELVDHFFDFGPGYTKGFFYIASSELITLENIIHDLDKRYSIKEINHIIGTSRNDSGEGFYEGIKEFIDHFVPKSETIYEENRNTYFDNYKIVPF